MKISCNIIQDLLPLYVDRMLSVDSCQLVEKHLEKCDACKSILEELQQEPDFTVQTAQRKIIEEDAVAAFKRVQRTIWRKRVLTAVLSAACVLAVVRAGYYFYFEKKTYISFEDSGLEMRGDQLYATKTYYGRLMSLRSPDQKTEFLFKIETAEIEKLLPTEACDKMITDYGNQPKTEEVAYPESEITKYGIEKVYYLPKEYIHFQFDYENQEIGEEQTKELEEHSILLWEKTESEEK